MVGVQQDGTYYSGLKFGVTGNVLDEHNFLESSVDSIISDGDFHHLSFIFNGPTIEYIVDGILIDVIPTNPFTLPLTGVMSVGSEPNGAKPFEKVSPIPHCVVVLMAVEG